MTRIDKFLTAWMIVMVVMIIVGLPTAIVWGMYVSDQQRVAEYSTPTVEQKCNGCSNCIKAQFDHLERLQYLNSNRGKPILNDNYWGLLIQARKDYEHKLTICNFK